MVTSKFVLRPVTNSNLLVGNYVSTNSTILFNRPVVYYHNQLVSFTTYFKVLEIKKNKVLLLDVTKGTPRSSGWYHIKTVFMFFNFEADYHE